MNFVAFGTLMMEKTFKGATAFLFDCLAIFCAAIILASMFFLCPFISCFSFFIPSPYPVDQEDFHFPPSCWGWDAAMMLCQISAAAPCPRLQLLHLHKEETLGALSPPFLCLALTLRWIPALNLFCFPIHKLNCYPEMLWGLMNAWKAHCRWKKYSAASSNHYV